MAVYLFGRLSFFIPMDNLFGRTQIFISGDITKDTVVSVLDTALDIHDTNVTQIEYLYDCYRGKQDVLNRTKEFNEYVNNKITENRFKEIIDFKTTFTAGNSIEYSTSDTDFADDIDKLNDFCRLEGKDTLDYDLVEWMNIAGTAYRLISVKPEKPEEGESPFYLATVDPRMGFVGYSTSIRHEAKMCCYMTEANDVVTYSVWAWHPDGKIHYYLIEDDNVLDEVVWTYSYLPIIEYPHGKARLGAAEPVISLLNALNNLDSARMDSIEQFVESLLVLINCKLPEGYTASTIKEMGLIELISNGENKAAIEQIASTLDQSNTQTFKEDMLQAIRDIVAMPTVSARSSGGDNGLAVIYRNGWEGAYQSATTDEKYINASEYQSLRLMLEICRVANVLDIPLRAIGIDYTREHYENMTQKVDSLIKMLQNDKIHPRVAYEVCGLFYDPNKKYLEGLSWYEEQKPMSDAVEEEEVVEEIVE